MKENSIEETIKQLELILKVRKEQKDIIESAGGSCINCDPDIKALSESIDILSDYKRVLKENEILKEEKEQAWEEWNNLEQGSYETGQKLKQQIKELQKENEELKLEKRNRSIGKYGDVELHDLINRVLSNNYISIQTVKDKMKEKEWALESYDCDEADYKQSQAIGAWSVLQELIEEREEK